MTDEIALAELRDEVLRKIGRNVVNFQKMEAMLKFLNALQDIRVSSGNLDDFVAKAEKATSKLPMGRLADAFLKSAYSSEHLDPEQESADEASVALSFRIEIDSALAAERKKALRSVVQERNKLIHQWVAHFNPDSPESCEALRNDLDEQLARSWPDLERLRALVETIQTSLGRMAHHLSSEAFRAALREHTGSD